MTSPTITLESFTDSVEEGLKLSKRLYYGKDRSITPPKPPSAMSKSTFNYIPTSPMVYAIVSDPSIVDNPDIPSYQPYVYGRCDPPALIPLIMNRVELEIDCYCDDIAVVKLVGEWRVHCVMGSKNVDCRLAVPMGEQGSILSVEVDVPRKSYHTQLVAAEDKTDEDKALGVNDGVLLRPDIFMLTIPQVDGGTNLSIKISWSQKLSYHDGEFSLCIPFSFPEYVTPASKKIPKREKIQLNVHPGGESEFVCKIVSHPLKEKNRQVDSLSFLYESDVISWSSMDFSFSFSVPSSHISGSVLLQPPSIDDIDQREMFCLNILPGTYRDKVFPKDIVYVIDTSGSMEGKPLEYTKRALCAALSELNTQDSFNIISFSGEISPFSESMKSASSETVEEATQWIDTKFVAGGGTNISLALNKAMEMLSATRDSLPTIILITDGAVEDERNICNVVKNHLSTMKTICPRIHTFGIGLYCNHYFLRMLAMIGRGLYDAAYEADGIEIRLQRLISRASSTLLANITFDGLDELSDVEIYPTSAPDLSSESTLVISGRCKGTFPEVVKVKGIVADMTTYELNLKVNQAKGIIPLERILALQQITICTSQAWFSESKQLESKVANMSIRNGIVSEYTSMALFVTETLKKEAEPGAKKKKLPSKGEVETTDPKPKEVKVLKNIGIGFGNMKATAENIPPGFSDPKPPEAAELFAKAASDCCTKVFGYCCCMCCLQVCSKVNNQCAIVLTQACTALACFGCLECCSAICCAGNDG